MIMATKSQIAQAQCERTAREYYAFRKKGGTANELVEIPTMKELLGVIKNKKILDAGCGFGFYSIYCAQQGAIVHAVDISETMIELAKREAKEADVEIEFKVQDITNLTGFLTNTFDIVISANAACFEVSKFLREASRVLKPKGILYLVEVHPIITTKYGDYLDKGIRKAKNVFGKLEPSDPDYEWQWEHYTLGDYFTAIRDAGFLIDKILEPGPDPTLKTVNPDLFKRASKYPIFVIFRAEKINL